MVSYGRAEYPQVFDLRGQVEISKFDKEARQDCSSLGERPGERFRETIIYRARRRNHQRAQRVREHGSQEHKRQQPF